jgi:hypothetical protein
MDGRFLNEVVAWDKRAAAEALSHEYPMATFAIDRGQPLTKEVLNDERQLSSRGDSALRLRQVPNARFVGCRTEALTVDPLELTQVIRQDLSVSPLPNDRGSTKEAVRELLEVALCIGLVAVIAAAASTGTLLPW